MFNIFITLFMSHTMKPLHLLVSCYGPPGVGKTTAATMIFSELKKRHVDVDLVTDFAKDMIIQGNVLAMQNQLYVWASQLYRNRCAYERATITITDTPVMLGAIYNTRSTTHFFNVALEEYHRFNNYNLMIPRNADIEYSMFGRVHNEDQSIQLGHDIDAMMETAEIPHRIFYEEELPDIIDEILSIVQ